MSSLVRVLSPTFHSFLPSSGRLLCSALCAGLLLLGAGCNVDDPANPNGGTAGSGGAAVAQGGGVAGGSAAGSAGMSGGASGGAGTSGSAGTPSGGSATAGSGTGGAAGGAAGAGGSAAFAGSGSGGGSGACAGKTYKLCDDFESGESGALPTSWTKFKGYGAGAATDVGLSTDEFHSGKLALKSSSMATGQTRAQRSLSTLGATASKHWGRIFYKVQSPATKPASGVLHVTFVGLMGTGENRVVDIVEDTKGAHQWLYNNPDDAGGKGSSYDWTFDANWHCAEWYVDVSTKSYKFFSDAKEVPSIGFTNKADSQMTDYKSIIVGAEFYQMPPAPFVMWFDDLAIDDNQIGCQ
jgi:hypothetical protein